MVVGEWLDPRQPGTLPFKTRHPSQLELSQMLLFGGLERERKDREREIIIIIPSKRQKSDRPALRRVRKYTEIHEQEFVRVIRECTDAIYGLSNTEFITRKYTDAKRRG